MACPKRLAVGPLKCQLVCPYHAADRLDCSLDSAVGLVLVYRADFHDDFKVAPELCLDLLLQIYN